MKVRCTGYWWHNKTLYEPNQELNVPDGTPVPGGFIVNGVATPKKKSMAEEKREAEAEAKSEFEALKSDVAELKNVGKGQKARF